jgi:hypothetical protein
VLQENARLLLGCLAQVNENIIGIVLRDKISVESFEVFPKGFLFYGSAVSRLTDLVLHLELAREVKFFGSKGFAGWQVGDVVVLFVLLAIPKARLVVGDGSVGL